jgi:two-component system cell cycle response regulator
VKRILSWWGDVWRGEPHASDLPMQGEHRVARSRVLIIAALTAVGLLVFAVDPSNVEFRRTLPINVACLIAAVGVLLATRRGNRPKGLSLTTSIGDVSLVTLLHVFDLVQGNPSAAVNGRVAFLAYFFALTGTAVRFDRRLALIAGVVATMQYAGVAVWSAAVWPTSATLDVQTYGLFDWGVQIERLALLLLFAVVCSSIASLGMRLRRSATLDELTGLLNRRVFEERVHDELVRAQRRGDPLSLVMIDVDHFKAVNDNYGHPAGDAALRVVATMLREAVRRTDLAARWGGEEFALALPGMSATVATTHLERLLARIAAQTIALPRGQVTRLTISAGVACAPEDASDPAALVRVADERLLRAKRGGRNRIVGAPQQARLDIF